MFICMYVGVQTTTKLKRHIKAENSLPKMRKKNETKQNHKIIEMWQNNMKWVK